MDFKFVNRNHHTSCFAATEPTGLTFDFPRHPPDPYTIPVAAQTFLKVKDASISNDNILNLCRTARVYFNSDREEATRRKLRKRLEDVSSPRRVKYTEKKLIPLEGFESKVRRSRRKRYSTQDDDNIESSDDYYSLNPNRVLPDINGIRKSRELSPRDSSADSPEGRRGSHVYGSPKPISLNRISRDTDNRNSRPGRGGYPRKRGNTYFKSSRDDNTKTESGRAPWTTFANKNDEKRLNGKRGDDSDEDYSDDE